jgi:hypothetical protein
MAEHSEGMCVGGRSSDYLPGFKIIADVLPDTITMSRIFSVSFNSLA